MDEADRLLNELIFGQWAEVQRSIDMGGIIDSLIFEGRDGLFATNSKNDWLQPGYRFLAQKGRLSLSNIPHWFMGINQW